MSRNDPKSVGDILQQLIHTTPLGKVLDQARIWESWPQLAGENLSKHGRPAGVKEQRLRVEVDSSAWMHKYSYCKWEIIRRINRMAGYEFVSDIFLILMTEEEAEAFRNGQS